MSEEDYRDWAPSCGWSDENLLEMAAAVNDVATYRKIEHYLTFRRRGFRIAFIENQPPRAQDEWTMPADTVWRSNGDEDVEYLMEHYHQ